MKKLAALSLATILLAESTLQASYLYFNDHKLTHVAKNQDMSYSYDEIVNMSGTNWYNDPRASGSAVCGYGLLGRHNKYSANVCNSRFASIDINGNDIGVYIVGTFMTFGLWIPFAGTMHREVIDHKKIRDYVNDSDGFEDIKKLIDFEANVDIVHDFELDDYVSKNTFEVNSEWEWSSKNDIAINDEEYDRWIYIDRTKSNAQNLMKILEEYASSAKPPQPVQISYVPKPALEHYKEPKREITQKSEYESKAEYEERLRKLEADYVNAVEKAKQSYYYSVNYDKQAYANAVKERNEKVKKEIENYKEGIEETNKQRAKMKEKLAEVTDYYKKILVLFSLDKPKVSGLVYDAESQYLKADFYDPFAMVSKALPIKMSPSDAKTLKENFTNAKIKAQYSFKDSILALEKLTIGNAVYIPTAADGISLKFDFGNTSFDNQILLTQNELDKLFPMQDPEYGESVDETKPKEAVSNIEPKVEKKLPAIRK